MPYTVYILYASDINKYYIGHTGDEIEERLRRHLSDHSGFTRRSKKWEIVYTETLNDKIEAMELEKMIKSWKSRKRVEDLINKHRG